MKIQSTRDYSLFKRIEGNRTKHQPHVNRLVAAIEAEPDTVAFTPIIVNEDYQVIDGQHRLQAIERLNLPVHYIKVEGLRLPTVQRLNSVAKTWTPIDYAKSYRELGNENYRIYLDFKHEFGLNHDILIQYLSFGKNTSTQAFRQGRFEATDVTQSYKFCSQLQELAEYYERATLRTQAIALLSIFQSPNYNHKRMVFKFRTHGYRINEQTTMPDYAREFERIYNWRSKSEAVRLF